MSPKLRTIYRVLLALLAPAVLPLVLGRILGRALANPTLRNQPVGVWVWLPLFVLAWVAGEASGYFASLRPRTRFAQR